MTDDASAEAQGVLRQELGTLEVADQVFRDLVRHAVSGAEGVAAVGRPSGLFRRGGGSEAVQVERGEGEVAFSIALSVRYDVRIPEMVADLRQRVRAAVEDSTGYRVRSVNVTIEHILPPEPEAPEQGQAESAPEPPPVADQE